MSPVRVAAAGCIGLALVFGLGSLALGFWAEGVPGPGLLPALSSALLLPLGARLWRQPSQVGSGTPFSRVSLAALVVVVGYALALPFLGIVVPTSGFLVVWARAFYRVPWRRALVLAGGLTALAVGLFEGALGIPLPLWPWHR